MGIDASDGPVDASQHASSDASATRPVGSEDRAAAADDEHREAVEDTTDVSLHVPSAAITTEAPSTPSAVVEQVLRPMVEADRGTIAWVGVQGGVAEVALGGACAGCPGQQYTLRSVILPALRAVDPSITQVRARLAL